MSSKVCSSNSASLGGGGVGDGCAWGAREKNRGLRLRDAPGTQ